MFVFIILLLFSVNYLSVNLQYNVKLHSHEVQYGAGSGQQSVTAVSDQMSENSYWQIKERNQSPQCNRGRIIKCGQKLRLLHVPTKKYLHSHHFAAPLSQNFEVSAFGNDGLGDEGDDWQIVCSDTYWLRSSKFQLKHISTDGFLYLSGKRYNRPISGQYEVSASLQPTSAIDWIVSEGVYLDSDTSAQTNKSYNDDDHDEL